MININKFKETLVDFSEYIRKYIYVNIVLLGLTIFSLYVASINQNFLFTIMEFAILLCPIVLVHLISESPKYDSYNECTDSDKGNRYFKKAFNKVFNYSIKYLKFYAFILFDLVLIGVLMYASMFISMWSLLFVQKQSLVTALALLFATFLLIEGFSLILSFIPSLVILDKEPLNPITALIKGMRVNKKIHFKHLGNVCLFGFCTIPLIIVSDSFNNYIYIASFLRTLYLILVLNFAVFDFKNVLNSNTPDVLYYKHKVKMKLNKGSRK